MSDQQSGRSFARPIVPVVLALGLALVVVWSQRPEYLPEPQNVDAIESVFASFADLRSASDLVVLGVVEAEVDGRVVTDPNNTTSGIRTRVYTVVVEGVLAGDSPNVLTIEHEYSLLDHTPILVNNVGPPRVGERAVFFLLAGPTADFPHFALVNSQARLPVENSKIASVSDDSLSRSIDGRSVDELIALLNK